MKDKAKERAEAQSAETPADKLQRLAQRYPREVLQNPVVPLLALEQPTFWHEILNNVWKGFRQTELRNLSKKALSELSAECLSRGPDLIKNLSVLDSMQAAREKTLSYAAGGCSLAELLCVSMLTGHSIKTRTRETEVTSPLGADGYVVSCRFFGIEAGKADYSYEKVIEIVCAWLFEEVTLTEMARRFVFTPTEKALIAETGGAEALVSLEWEQRKKDSSEDHMMHGPLLLAAEKHLKLRQLFIFSAHFEIHFSRSTFYPFASQNLPIVVPKHHTTPQQYYVRMHNIQLGEGNAEEAAASAQVHTRSYWPRNVG